MPPFFSLSLCTITRSFSQTRLWPGACFAFPAYRSVIPGVGNLFLWSSTCLLCGSSLVLLDVFLLVLEIEQHGAPISSTRCLCFVCWWSLFCCGALQGEGCSCPSEWLILGDIDERFQNAFHNPAQASLRPGFYFAFYFIDESSEGPIYRWCVVSVENRRLSLLKITFHFLFFTVSGYRKLNIKCKLRFGTV